MVRANADQWLKKVQAPMKGQGTDPADPVGDVPASSIDLSFVETWAERIDGTWVLHFSLVVASFTNTTCELGFLIESDSNLHTGEHPEGIDYYVALNPAQNAVIFKRYDLNWTYLDPTGINDSYSYECLDAINPGVPPENIVGVSFSLPLTLLERRAGNLLSLRAVTQAGNLTDRAPDTEFMTILLVIIPGDLNGDGTVDIYDAIILANAYNSRPGAPNWNVAADINNDGTVDIYDAILLANNYGKTT
jgi:hypothetical protein